MSTFRFRLATLLRIQEAARDQRRSELAEAFRAEQTLRERMQGLEQQFDELKQQYRQSGESGQVNVDRLIDVQRYELVLSVEQQLLRQHEAALAQEIEKRRQALVAADREVRVLEKLREKQHERHRADDERQQVKQIDEIAARRVANEEVT
jgi:flagellar export protein FliJ